MPQDGRSRVRVPMRSSIFFFQFTWSHAALHATLVFIRPLCCIFLVGKLLMKWHQFRHHISSIKTSPWDCVGMAESSVPCPNNGQHEKFTQPNNGDVSRGVTHVPSCHRASGPNPRHPGAIIVCFCMCPLQSCNTIISALFIKGKAADIQLAVLRYCFPLWSQE
jgi:hypothetical protein